MNSRACLILLALVLTLPGLHAQGPAGMSGPPGLSPMITQLFGDHKAFTANLLLETGAQDKALSLPGKLSFLNGKSRLEMDMSRAQGGAVSPQTAAQLKAMGMTEIVYLTGLAAEGNYLVYPGLKAYAPAPASGPTPKPEEYTLTRTDLGKETVDGRPCTKQKVVVKTPGGEEHEATLWLATDLKEFPIRIDFAEGRHQGRLRFQDVTLEEPAAAQFQPPAEFTKYNSMQEMMTTIMLKRFGNSPAQP